MGAATRCLRGRRYLRKGGDERTHHVHIYGVNSRESIERHIAVRDCLRAHKDIAEEYGELKAKLALMYPYDNGGYCDGKDAFVRQLEQSAILWYRRRRVAAATSRS